MEIIKPLSEDVQSMVRSGFIISCLTTVVEELIYNSLDAGATKVSVCVAVNNGYVKVEDDGSGISRSGLVLLGERYATSKLRHFHEKDDFVRTFGFRGEVLCSIADISLVEIVTRVQGRPNGYRKVMKGRKCLCLSIDNDRQAVGTTVIVRDLFYNQPVRRKQMQCSAKKVLHSVKKCAVRIALVQPNISFKVRDMESENELLCTRSCPSPLSLLCSNFGIKASTLHDLSYSEGPLKLTGYVSSLSVFFSTKAVQYIYINARFVDKGPIHKVLNRLADMGHDQLRVDRGAKRNQPQRPFYCLNLTCPCYSYDLNLEFSRASVEFKDWAPVLAFVEKSIMSLWSEEIKSGISHNYEADWNKKDVNENLVERTSVEKGCWLKTCEMSAKRRRTQRNENQHAYAKESLELLVEHCNNLSHWDDIYRQHLNSESVTAKYRESETVRESHVQMALTGIDDASLSNFNFDIKDSNGSDLLEPNKRDVDSDFLTNGIISMDTEANYASNCRSSSRWREEDSIEDPFVEFDERGSVWNFDFIQEENGSARSKGAHSELLLQSSSSANSFQTSLEFGKESQFHIDNFKANRSFSNSHGNGDADILSQKFDSFQSGQCHSEVANTFPLTKSKTGNRTTKNLDDDHLECNKSLLSYGESFDREFPLESSSQRGRVLFSCSPTICDQKSASTYPILKPKEWDFENFIQDECFKRRSGVRNSDGNEPFNYDKEEFFRSGLDDRCSNRDYLSKSCLDSRLLFTRESAGVEKGMWEFPVHGQNVDETASIRSDSFQGIYSPSTDRMHKDSQVCRNSLISYTRGMDIDLQLYQELGSKYAPIEKFGRIYDSSDELLIDRCDAVVTSETFSPCFDFQHKLSPSDPPVSYFSPLSSGKGPGLDLPRCQIPNCSSSESGSSLRTRSHSAPPFYRGKKKFQSVTSSLSSTTENSALQTASQACTFSERTQLKHPSRPTLSCSVNHQSDEMRSGDSSLFFVERKVNETSNITQVGAWSQDVTTETANFSSGHLMKVRDSEILLTKWREGCTDAGLKEISSFLTAGDRVNDLKDENEILNTQSSMLNLAGDSLVPKSISRSDLQNAKVLWQIDNKYIPVVACGTLAVIDQHAADERIQLEEMRQKVLSGEMKSIKYLDKEKDLVLPEMAYQLLCNYADHIKHWGWICNIFSEEFGSFAKNLNLLNERASNLTLIAVPCILGVSLSDADLVEYLEQLADTDGSSTIPPSVVRILNYKACRGAIMFGDKLLPSECSLIVEELKRTSLCFQCAHGRPTTVPLVNLKALHEGILYLRSWYGHSINAWHGLCKNKVSLDRAKHRLDIARCSG